MELAAPRHLDQPGRARGDHAKRKGAVKQDLGQVGLHLGRNRLRAVEQQGAAAGRVGRRRGGQRRDRGVDQVASQHRTVQGDQAAGPIRLKPEMDRLGKLLPPDARGADHRDTPAALGGQRRLRPGALHGRAPPGQPIERESPEIRAAVDPQLLVQPLRFARLGVLGGRLAPRSVGQVLRVDDHRQRDPPRPVTYAEKPCPPAAELLSLGMANHARAEFSGERIRRRTQFGSQGIRPRRVGAAVISAAATRQLVGDRTKPAAAGQVAEDDRVIRIDNVEGLRRGVEQPHELRAPASSAGHEEGSLKGSGFR